MPKYDYDIIRKIVNLMNNLYKNRPGTV